MGDRANVVIKTNGEQVCLYTHWNGYELPKIVRSAMNRGRDRLNDKQYLTRIIFCEMISGDVMGTSGYGISQSIGDGADKVITVDVDLRTVTVGEKQPVQFEEFMRDTDLWGRS
jgi:hypothetical protein